MTVTKRQMLKKLQETEFPKNTGRQNILKKNQEFSRSMALGKMKALFQKKGTFTRSRHNRKHPMGSSVMLHLQLFN